MASLKTKILIDRFFGIPAVYCLNILARTLGGILKIDHSLDIPVKNIVVCKFVGMGSIIQTTPMLQTLKLNYPEAKVIFVSSRSNKELLATIQVIDEVILLNDSNFLSILKSSFSMLFNLWRKKINLYFDLELYSNYSTVISTLSLATNRFGYYRRSQNVHLGIYTHMMFFNANVPISQIHLQMCRIGGCSKTVDELYTIIPDKSHLQVLKNRLNKQYSFDLASPYILVNANASDFVIERRWSQTNFARLITLVLESFPDIKILLTGNEKERMYVEGIAKEVNHPGVLNMAGVLNIPDLVNVTDHSRMMISNDSGPMHLSLSLNKCTIALFGPGSPAHYGINNKNLHVFYEQVYCSPCIYNFDTPPCKGDNQCMKRIAAEDVFKVVKALLNKEEPPHPVNGNIIYTQLNNNNIPLGIVKRR